MITKLVKCSAFQYKGTFHGKDLQALTLVSPVPYPCQFRSIHVNNLFSALTLNPVQPILPENIFYTTLKFILHKCNSLSHQVVSLLLTGPTWENVVLNPLAVQHLDNLLSMKPNHNLESLKSTCVSCKETFLSMSS